MTQERLQKILSRAGVCSRRKAEGLIEAGRVTVNGSPAVLGQKADPAEDAIKVDGKRVPPAVPHRYLLLNKPDGHMSTVSDPEGRPTVLDLIPRRLHRALVPVGRLDYHTEGLILLTTDGDFAQRVAHPRYGCHKVYEVKVKGMPEDEAVEKLRSGLEIEGRKTRPTDVSFLRRTKARGSSGNTWWRVTLGEGRTRQIREMFFRVGHPVQRLRRVAIGGLEDTTLPKGAWRELTEREVRDLRDGSASGGRRKVGPRSTGTADPRRRGERKRRKAARAAGDGGRGRGERRSGKPRDQRSGSSKPRRPRDSEDR